MIKSSAASTPLCMFGYSPGWTGSLQSVQCRWSCGFEVSRCLVKRERRRAYVAVAHASPSYSCSIVEVCMGLFHVLLPGKHSALCSISSLSSSENPALIKSDLGNSAQSQMLLFVPLQGFPFPTRNAGSCRALYSAESQKFCLLLLRSLAVSG